MNKPVLNYEKMVEDAMRGVVRKALNACKNGLPGAHHFFIAFRTRFPGVEITDGIRSRYPDEMTIVLQHQFWGLEVGRDKFEVTLSFNRIGERLVIPYASITKFTDPSAQWGLEFAIEPELEIPLEFFDMREAPITPPSPKATASMAELPQKTVKKPRGRRKATPQPSSGGAEVFALDAFRKK